MIQLLIIATCLLLNAILSCIEMAFVTVSKAHIKKLSEMGNGAAKRVLLLKSNPERTLSVLQVGITLVGAISAAITGISADQHLTPYFMNSLSLSREWSNFLSIAVIALPLTYLSVVIGELVPKSIALRFPLRIALTGGLLLIILERVFHPFVYLLESSTRFLTKYIFANFKPESAISSTGDVDLANLTDAHKQYIFNLINVDKRTVKDVMLPWEQVTKLYINDHQHEVLEKIKAARHTRMPVIDENDEVVGLLHAKEFVSESEISKLDWKQLIRTIPVLGPKEHILSALKRLQNKKSHLAIIKDEGVVIGIVTMEDIFEEIVGEIYDEDDDPNTLLSVNSRIRTMQLKK